eukprot:SAG22_NODE_1014_length_6027_cov_3.998988_4_plen_77_part_00
MTVPIADARRCSSGGLWWDEEKSHYIMFYSCGNHSNSTCVGTSTDGKHFTKPDLGPAHNNTNRVLGSQVHDGNVVT